MELYAPTLATYLLLHTDDCLTNVQYVCVCGDLPGFPASLEHTAVTSWRFFPVCWVQYDVSNCLQCAVFCFVFFSLPTAVDVYAGACSQADSGVAARS